MCSLFNDVLAKNSIRATAGRGPLPLKKVLQNFKDKLGLSTCNKLGPETQACPYLGKLRKIKIPSKVTADLFRSKLGFNGVFGKGAEGIESREQKAAEVGG